MTAFPPIWLAAAASLGYFHPDLPLITAAMATFNSLYSFMVRTYVHTVFHTYAYTYVRTFCSEFVSLFLSSSLFSFVIFSLFKLFRRFILILFVIRYFQWDVSMDWGLFTITRNGSVHWRQVKLLHFLIIIFFSIL